MENDVKLLELLIFFNTLFQMEKWDRERQQRETQKNNRNGAKTSVKDLFNTYIILILLILLPQTPDKNIYISLGFGCLLLSILFAYHRK